MRRTIICTLLLLLTLSLCLETRAEVSVRTDRSGNYVKTQIIPVGPQSENRAWGLRGLRGRYFRNGQALNTSGDINGDLWPTIAESPEAPHFPMVVWSRFNGFTYDMAWSRWTGDQWTSIRFIATRPTPGDDLDADLAFDSNGRPYVAWWAEMEEGGGKVFFSVFLANRWLAPVLLSNPAVDSRLPVLDVSTPQELSVTYETPDGSVTQYVTFATPETITEDINPQNTIILYIPTALMGWNK